MWPRLVASKFLGAKSGCESFNKDDGRDTESETEDEDIAPLPSEAPPNKTRGPSLLSVSSTASSNPPVLSNPGKPPKFSNSLKPPSASPLQKTHLPSSSDKSGPPSGKLMRMKSETLWSQYMDAEEYSVFVGTWNVAGITPSEDLDLENWLKPSEQSDIYVIGFQEIVPLKAGNVFGSEDVAGPASKWVALIRKTLNETKTSERGMAATLARSSSLPLSTLQASTDLSRTSTYPITAKDDIDLANCGCDSEFDLAGAGFEQFSQANAEDESGLGESKPRRRRRYKCVASKRMVGIFISIWVRAELRIHIRDVKVCCVGCGIMGCLGNKGSVSVSLSLQETSFCFVCTHLASGQKEGDELRRNADVSEILKRTIFNRSPAVELPKSILGHDRIIWFGDLNYRIALSHSEVKPMVEKEDWKTLLQSDQLRAERSMGRAFDGWHEGPIQFAPTYKFAPNSDQYSGVENKVGEKRRAPAWCDRILWYGKGLKQLSYVRVDLNLSDHRPVAARFLADVEVLSNRKVKKTLGLSKKAPEMANIITREIQKLSKTRHEETVYDVDRRSADAVVNIEKSLLPILNEIRGNHNLELGVMLNQHIDAWEKECHLQQAVDQRITTDEDQNLPRDEQ